MKINSITKFFLLGLATITLSCTDDDGKLGKNEALQTGSNFTDIQVTLQTNDLPAFLEEGEDINYTAQIGSSFEGATTVTSKLSLSLTDNKRFTEGPITIDAGQTSNTGVITIPNHDDLAVDFNGYTAYLSAVGVGVDQNTGTLYKPSSNQVTFKVYDKTPKKSSIGLSYLVDWAGAPAVDIDIFVYGDPFRGFLERSTTGDRYEDDILETTHRDGTYTMGAYVFSQTPTVTTKPIPFRVFAISSSGKRTLIEGEIPAGVTAAPRLTSLRQLNPIARIVKNRRDISISGI